MQKTVINVLVASFLATLGTTHASEIQTPVEYTAD